MRKSEEFVSNKKRFYDSFGPEGDSKDDHDDKEEADEQNKKEKAEDFNLLFSGNVEGNFSLFFSKTYFLRQKFLIDFKIQDHFKIGLSVAKKSIKLYTEFYSSDIIIASPLGLKSVIGIEEYVLVNCFKTIKTIKIKIIKIKTETKKETMIS
jgi:U3 small nucleolar RNA-associated protein 25